MANTGNVVATADLLIQAQVNNAQLNAAATKAAKDFDAAFAKGQKQFQSTGLAQQTAAVANLSKMFQGLGTSIPIKQMSAFQTASIAASKRIDNVFKGNNQTIKNLQAGFRTLGQVIGARLPSSVANFGKAVSSVAGQVTGTLQGVGSQLSGLAGGFGALGTVGVTALLGIAAAVGAVTANFARQAADFQALEVSLGNIINNSESANTTTETFIASLRKLALQSGFSSTSLANTGRQFLALEFSGRKTTEILNTLTRAAALTGAGQGQLDRAFSGVAQIASKGAVAMEELRRQIAENLPGAVNLTVFFEQLGIQMGVSTEEARKLQEQGLAPAEEGIEALLATINLAPGITNAFESRLTTLNGVLGVLKEGFRQVVQDGFRPFIEAIQPILSDLIEGQGVFENLQPAIEKFGKAMGEGLRDILEEIIPRLPKFIDLFVKLVQAAVPVVTTIARIGFVLSDLLLPTLITIIEVFTSFIEKINSGTKILLNFANAIPLVGRFFGEADGQAKKAEGSLGKAFGSIGTAIDSIKEKFTKDFDLGKSVDALVSKFQGLFSATENLNNAQAALTKANENLTKSVADVAELEADRLVILADTTSEINEIAEAQDKLLRINNRLRDIDEDHIELLEELAELRTPATADELAEADRKMERAKIALAKAQREEIELNKELTKEQRRSLNLTGLSLDELRNTLANARASLDAERSLNDEKEDGSKTQAEIDEERALARLDVVDAEQTIRDLEAEKLDLTNKQLNNADEIREKEQQIANLAIDKRDAIRDQGTAQTTLNTLRAGETTQAAAIKTIDDQIAAAKEKQRDAVLQVATSQNAIKEATLLQQIEEAKIEGNLIRQNQLQLELIGWKAHSLGLDRQITGELNNQITAIRTQNTEFLAQQRQLAAPNSVFGQLLNVSPALTQGILGGLFQGGNDKASQAINALGQALIVSEPFIRNLRAGAPPGGRHEAFAEGGLITHPTFARIGEGFKHELMLPLTKPDRVWSLLSQHLPKYPGALGAAQAALGTPDISARALRVGPTSGGTQNTGNHWERDVLTELRMMRETISNIEPSGDLKVEVRQSNEAELLRKIRREIEKSQAKRRR